MWDAIRLLRFMQALLTQLFLFFLLVTASLRRFLLFFSFPSSFMFLFIFFLCVGPVEVLRVSASCQESVVTRRVISTWSIDIVLRNFRASF